MDIVKKVFSNTFYQVFGKIVTASSTLVISALITRILGAETFGEYSVVTAYTTTFYMLSDFGINAIVVQDFNKGNQIHKSKFSAVLLLRFILGAFLTLLAIAILQFMPYSDLIKTAILLSLPLIILNSIFRASSVIFQAFLKYKLQFISNFLGSIVGVGIVIWAFLSGSVDLNYLIVLVVIGSAIAPIISLIAVREFISLKVEWVDFSYWKDVFLRALPFGIGLSLNSLMIQIDRLILSVLKSSLSVGIYSLAYRIFELILVLPTFFMNALYPVLVNLKSRNEEKYYPAITLSLFFLSITAGVLAVLGMALSPLLIPLIWGAEMKNAYIPFNILMLGVFFFFLTAPLSWIAVIEERQRKLPAIYGFGFVFNAFFNFVFIPKYDYVGAAAVTVVTEFLVLLALIWMLRDVIRFSPYSFKMAKSVVKSLRFNR